jgi:phosphotriesterase-related protein
MRSKAGLVSSESGPGVIGEIGANGSSVSAQEERVRWAAARAQLATGLSLTTHSVFNELGLAQLRIFEEEGVDAKRVAVGHCDSWPDLSYYLRIISRGAYIQLDNFGQLQIGRRPSEENEAG